MKSLVRTAAVGLLACVAAVRGHDMLIAGDSAPWVLIRGGGPALHAQFGLTGVLATPQLTLCHQAGKNPAPGGACTAETNRDEIRDAAVFVGAFAFGDASLDSAMVAIVAAGRLHRAGQRHRQLLGGGAGRSL